MSTEFVAFRPEHAAAIAQLQTHLWSGDAARNADYFRWKYLENPYQPEPLVFLAMSDGRAVAMRGAFGAAWEANGAREPLRIPCVDDMVVDPAHRNRGVVRPLMRALLDDLGARGFRYALSLSASPITLVASLATGWKAVGSTEPIGRIEPRVAAARRLRACVERIPMARRFAPRLVLASEREPFRLLDESRRRRRRITLMRDPRTEEMAALVRRIGGDGRIRHVRDARYLDWRFRNPLAEYRFFYWDDQMLNGYLVLRRTTSDRGNQVRVQVVEWEATSLEIRLALLDEAIERGAFANLETWGATLPGPLRSELARRGFRAAEPGTLRRPGHRILVQRLDPTPGDWTLNGRALLDMSHWDLRLVHSMAG
jgi:ribosomal protein S18 acetylase RimI-like enzyme